jgi:CRISPR-associated protein Cmr5
MSNLRILEGGRAKFAYECAQEAVNAGDKSVELGKREGYFKATNYKSYVKKAPMWIKTNGIGAAFAFILSKKAKEKDGKPPGSEKNPKNAYDLLYEQTMAWLRSEGKEYLLGEKRDKDLVAALVELPSHEYRAVTVEVLALLNWLRRFAEGLIEADEDNDNP